MTRTLHSLLAETRDNEFAQDLNGLRNQYEEEQPHLLCVMRLKLAALNCSYIFVNILDLVSGF